MFGENMDKQTVLGNCKKFLAKKGSFAYRVCKLLVDEEFSGVLSSADLAHLLNEGAGKKIKPNNLTALMEPLLCEDIVKVKIVGTGRNKKKFWFPGWLDKKQLECAFNPDKGAMFFSGKGSWTDPNKNFPKIISLLEGDLCILDPYYGNGTFFALEKFGNKRKIRFLTCKLGNEEQENRTKFDINLRRFKKEFKNIELKAYGQFYELHDRYIISDNALVLIGYGIKDLADKESFIVFLPKNLVKDFLPTLKKTFEIRWKKSNNI